MVEVGEVFEAQRVDGGVLPFKDVDDSLDEGVEKVFLECIFARLQILEFVDVQDGCLCRGPDLT